MFWYPDPLDWARSGQLLNKLDPDNILAFYFLVKITRDVRVPEPEPELRVLQLPEPEPELNCELWSSGSGSGFGLILKQ